jgi:site-specific DNA recombinase
MADRNSKQGGLIPAVAYLRMSDKKQDKSIPDQKAEIEKYAAANGYQILRWYRDDGISGAETIKRVGFQSLILAAQQDRDFEVIIVWDQDRFSRFDPMEANYYWYILRQAGVRIVTVATGELDFSDLGGWLAASVAQHGKAQYLRDLSRNVLRGRVAKARQGKWQGNRAPYGYQIVNGGDLAIATDGTAEVVKRIFDAYAETDSSLCDIANDLNVEGIPSPSGRKWNQSSVGTILRRECYYTGKMLQLRTPKGKFYSVVDGDIVACGQAKLDRGQGFSVDCPTLVSPALWKRTQQYLKRRQTQTTPTLKPSESVLRGILHCANCGNRMYARDYARGANPDPTDRTHWCSTYHHHGTHGCTRNLVHEKAILGFVIPKIQEMLLSPETVERLTRSLIKQAGRTKVDGAPALRKRIAVLEGEIAGAVRELKRTPDDLYDLAIAEVRKLRGERDAAVAALNATEARHGANGQEADACVRAALERATRLREALGSADRRAVRHALGEIVERIDLFFEPIPGAKITRSALTRGVVRFQKGSQLLARDNRPG